MARYEISGISLSPQGGKTGKRILETLEDKKKIKDLSVKWYYRPELHEETDSSFIVMDKSLAEWVADRFEDSSILIFIGSISRVFMLTAPYAADHANGMTILVIDEFGRFCVPLLSGRRNEGGELASLFEKELGITAVDMLSAKKGHDFSIERFAKENRMTISNSDYAREIMTSLYNGETVGLYTNYRFTGVIPLGMEFTKTGEKGIYISPSFHNAFFDRTLWLIPRCMIVDIDCPPGTISNILLNAIDAVLKKLSLFQEAIEIICVPMPYSSDSLLSSFCGDRDIKIMAMEKGDIRPKYDEHGFEYRPVCDMEVKGGIRCKVSMKNIVLHFLG